MITQYKFGGKTMKLQDEDQKIVEQGKKILEKRGLIRPTMADVFRAALTEFVRSGK